MILLQENSLKEWSYNFAITTETYDGYDPIPVPFNIIYSIAKLLKLVKKKENKEKKERQVLLNIYRNGGSSWVKITNFVNTLNVPWCSQVVLPFSVALGNWEYFFFSLYWLIHVVHGRVTPATKFAVTHLIYWVERDTRRVKCLGQDHNAMTSARPPTRTASFGIERANH